MRLSHSSLASAAAALVLSLTVLAVSPGTAAARDAAPPDLFGASCFTRTTGSRVVAHCSNPYPDVDRVRLHIECDRWWDIDTDTAAVDVGPAQTVRLQGRCWKEIRAAWISHQRVR